MSSQHDQGTRPVAIVTGGSRGIGLRIVNRLCLDGYAVLFTHSSSPEEAAQVVDEAHGHGLRLWAERIDVTAEDAPRRLFDVAERIGTVVALVNNAGITGPLGPFVETSDGNLARLVDVNLLAPARLCREAARRWTADQRPAPTGGWRRIVNVSSVAARTGSPHEYVGYAATKAGLEALTVGLAKELAPQRIRVNAVAPGTTSTTIHARAGDPGRAERVAASIPMRRPAEPDEVAAAVCWLLSAEASYVTGTVLDVTGGL